MFNNSYTPAYNPQLTLDRINNQIVELEKIKNQMAQQPIQPPTNLTQNFQIAPTNREIIKYANSIEDVQKDIVMGDTPYFSKDMSIVWIKNSKGEIKSYELIEIEEKDAKDLQIEYLMSQVEELKGMIKNESNDTVIDGEYDEADTTEDYETTRATTKKGKSTGLQRISASKRK